MLHEVPWAELRPLRSSLRSQLSALGAGCAISPVACCAVLAASPLATSPGCRCQLGCGDGVFTTFHHLFVPVFIEVCLVLGHFFHVVALPSFLLPSGYQPSREAIIFRLDLGVSDFPIISILILSDLFFIPLPNAIMILNSDSCMKISKEMSEWELEEFVAPVDYHVPNDVRHSFVFGVPSIKVDVAPIDQLYLCLRLLFFISWFWWIDNGPEPCIFPIQIIVPDQS